MGADGLRADLVDRLVAAARVRSPSVERAFRMVPRHLFLPDSPIEQAYQDEAVATKWQDGVAVSSASQPSMMAIMLEQLQLRPGHRALEIGAGTGYNAALMSELVGPTGTVAAVDIDEDLVLGAGANLAAAGYRGVMLATRDGGLGYPELAPYDRIVLTVGSWDVQPAWWRQLAPGGRLLLPLSVRGSQLSVALDLVSEPTPMLHSVSVRSCAFVRLRGLGAGPDPSRPVTDGLAVQTGDDREVDVAGLVRLLAQPGVDRPMPVRLSAVDLWDGLGLWLAVREPDACRLLVSASSRCHHSLSLLPAGADGGTMMLVGTDGLAVLVGRQPDGDTRGRQPDGGGGFPVAVRPYGPGGCELADRLAGSLRDWLTAGRPASTGLRLWVYPDGDPPPEPVPGVAQLRKSRSWLAIDWPENLDARGPKLGR